MRYRIAVLIGTLVLAVGACESATAPALRSGGDARPGFDGAGGTLGSGYGAPRAPADTSQQATADTTSRIGGTLGSGY
jgi:hypothetical protein